MLHNGKRQSVYQVSWRSPNFCLKQVICIRNYKTSSFLNRTQDHNAWLQGTWASFSAADQPRSHFGDCCKYSRSPETFHLGRGDRGEEGEDGGNDGGGELRRDGLTKTGGPFDVSGGPSVVLEILRKKSKFWNFFPKFGKFWIRISKVRSKFWRREGYIESNCVEEIQEGKQKNYECDME